MDEVCATWRRGLVLCVGVWGVLAGCDAGQSGTAPVTPAALGDAAAQTPDGETGSAGSDDADTAAPAVPCDPAQCDDKNGCTFDGCGPLGCAHNPLQDGAFCDDGDGCTFGSRCTAGLCGAGQPVVCPPNGATPCQERLCVSGACGPVPLADGTACDDGNVCTENDHCAVGACAGTLIDSSACITPCVPLDCNDNNPCTTDTCEVGPGCVHVPLPGVSCDDGDGCTTDTFCVNALCAGGVLLDCDDEEPCTEDACTAGACQHLAFDGPAPGQLCNDGEACTIDRCSGGSCQHTPNSKCCLDVAECDDGVPCTYDVCTDNTCVNVSAGQPCDDGDPCTYSTTCVGAACVGLTATCDDGKPCTIDQCVAMAGCSHTNAGPETSCDDGSPCTQDERCLAGVCHSPVAPCDDHQPCTLDVCGSDGVCANTPVTDGAACDDGELCTAGDVCTAGECAGPLALSCDDGDPCTVNRCTGVAPTDQSPGAGCSFPALVDGANCDDKDACTFGSTCTQGHCSGGKLITCPDPDGDPCSVAACTGGACHMTSVCP